MQARKLLLVPVLTAGLLVAPQAAPAKSAKAHGTQSSKGHQAGKAKRQVVAVAAGRRPR